MSTDPVGNKSILVCLISYVDNVQCSKETIVEKDRLSQLKLEDLMHFKHEDFGS